MKNNILIRGLSLFILLLSASCASYTATLVKLDPAGPNVSKVAQGDLTLYIEEYATPE